MQFRLLLTLQDFGKNLMSHELLRVNNNNNKNNNNNNNNTMLPKEISTLADEE